MTKTTYTATDPNGVVHTRKSERTYVATVVYQLDREAYYTNARSERTRYLHKRNGQYNLDCIANGKHLSHMGFKHYASDAERQARDVADSKERLAGATTADEYADMRVAEELARLDATDWTIWHNAGWCGRMDLAVKLAAKFCTPTRILPVSAK